MEGCGWGSSCTKNPWTVKKFIAQSKDTKPVIQNNIITESESSRPLLFQGETVNFAESFVDDSLGKIILFFFFI